MTDQSLMLERLERPLAMSWEDQRSLLSVTSTPTNGAM
jgi:hypothetical protein